MQNRWRIDDVLGVWPLHGLCGAWGGIAAGIFGAKSLGGLGGISLGAQLVGTLIGIVVALVGGGLVYGGLKALVGIRLDPEAEFEGADLAIHKISATPERSPPSEVADVIGVQCNEKASTRPSFSRQWRIHRPRP